MKKLYDISIDPTDLETGLNAISLVENPAVEVDFLAFAKDESAVLQFADEERHIITGIALLADTPIYRIAPGGTGYYVRFTKDCIRQLVEKYFKFGLTNSVNIEHKKDQFVDGVTMLESYIIDKERGICPNEFASAPDGSWVVSYKVNNLDVWSKIKSGEVKGFSVQGLFRIIETKLEMNSNKPNVFLSCVKTKAESRCKARDMYISPLFTKSLELAERLDSPNTYILSAKHHLLPLDTEIDPYNETLLDFSADEKKAWADIVIEQMKKAGIDFNAKTYFFAGENYIEYLRDYFPNRVEMFSDQGGLGYILEHLDELIASGAKFSKEDIEEVYKFYKEENSENSEHQNKNNISLMSKLKEKIKALLMQYAAVSTDKGNLIYNTDMLEVGSEVFVEDENGENVPAADGDYVLEDGRTVEVEGGKVTKIEAKEEEPAMPAAPAMPAEEQMVDETTETPAEPAAPAEDEKVTALEERVATLESQLADVIAKLAEIQTTPAASPAEEEFDNIKKPKVDPKNKMAAIAAAYRAAKERK